MVVRSRYAEDRLGLSEGPFSQYVILGAGLDSFAWRRPDILASVRVFEVDQPSSQAWKLQRATDLTLPRSDRHVFAPVDFEVSSLREGLASAGFDWTEPTLFSWMGVTMYLSTDAITATLCTIAECVTGSEVALSYRADPSVLDAAGRKLMDLVIPIAAESGEAFQGEGRTVAEMEQLVQDCGLAVVDQPTRDELTQRFLEGRDDGLLPWSIETLLCARVV